MFTLRVTSWKVLLLERMEVNNLKVARFDCGFSIIYPRSVCNLVILQNHKAPEQCAKSVRLHHACKLVCTLSDPDLHMQVLSQMSSKSTCPLRNGCCETAAGGGGGGGGGGCCCVFAPGHIVCQRAAHGNSSEKYPPPGVPQRLLFEYRSHLL